MSTAWPQVQQNIRRNINTSLPYKVHSARARNGQVSREQLDPLLRQLRDPDDRAGDLIAFLESLSDDSFDRTIPTNVPSGLRPGGNIR